METKGLFLPLSGSWRKPMKPYPTLDNHHEGDNHFRCYQIIHYESFAKHSRIPLFELEHFNCCFSSDLGNTMQNQTQSSQRPRDLVSFWGDRGSQPKSNIFEGMISCNLPSSNHCLEKNIHPHHWITCSYIIHADLVRVVWTKSK